MPMHTILSEVKRPPVQHQIQRQAHRGLDLSVLSMDTSAHFGGFCPAGVGVITRSSTGLLYLDSPTWK